MKFDRCVAGILATAGCLGMGCLPALAQPATGGGDDQAVAIGGRLQWMAFGEQLQSDPFRNASRLYLFQKQSRLDVTAHRGDYGLYSQLALGGEDVFTSNTGLTLLDMYARGPLLGLATWRVGQFRVPFGRELMSEGGSLSFLDRSLTSPFFTVGRDVGAALQGPIGPASVIACVFTGGGRDVPQRYLPEILGIPLLATRVSWGDVDEDAFTLGQHDHIDTTKTRMGVAWNAMYLRDSLVGHSSVLNVKNAFEKSLLLAPAWNPFIGRKDPVSGKNVQGQLWQMGLDGSVKVPVAGGVWSGEAEIDHGRFDNSFGAVGVTGGRLQMAYAKLPFEVALRYAVLMPDANFAVTNATAGSPDLGKTTAIMPDGTPLQEITPAVTYFVAGDKLKLMLDFPILVNAPIVTEAGLGNYNLVNQPDQTSLLTNPAHTLARQLVFQVRGGLQYAF